MARTSLEAFLSDEFGGFGGVARGLARNPIGIIALFIVLVYGFACLVTTFASTFTPSQKTPLIYFLVFFPILVLGVFCWLTHTGKIYGPGDYKDESNFMRMQAVVNLSLASNKGKERPEDLDISSLISIVDEANSTQATSHEVWRNTVLWVDDRPENNVFERKAFEAVGVNFVLAESTADALAILSRHRFAAIISDMGRREGPREGYVLLDKLRKQKDSTPFFIYAGSNSDQHQRETVLHGGQGCTNNAHDLFKMVTRAI